MAATFRAESPAPHRLRLLWPLAIAALIFAASSRSQVASPHVTQVDDKIVHFAVYGLFATLVGRLGRGWRWALTAVALVSAFGVSDEWHQSFVPGRSTEVLDWAADTTGAAIAVALYFGWARYRRWLEHPLKRRGAPAAAAAPVASV